MLKSMTGFGRYESATEERRIVVEIKAVNHRYCDISIKMPKKLNFFEAGIRNIIKKYVNRGKLDVFIIYEDYAEKNVSIKYNPEIAQAYFDILSQLGRDFYIPNTVGALELSRYPDVITTEEQTLNEEKLWTLMEEAVIHANEKFVESRITEGQNLKKDLLVKLDIMLGYVNFIEERAPQIIEEYRNKLRTKVEELLGDTKLDEGILATELVVFADKICVDEETVRLKSHIENMKQTLSENDSVGRKLDFIAQEMNREANTILSKANDLAATNIAIDLKTEIEKVREQIQNIE